VVRVKKALKIVKYLRKHKVSKHAIRKAVHHAIKAMKKSASVMKALAKD